MEYLANIVGGGLNIPLAPSLFSGGADPPSPPAHVPSPLPQREVVPYGHAATALFPVVPHWLIFPTQLFTTLKTKYLGTELSSMEQPRLTVRRNKIGHL